MVTGGEEVALRLAYLICPPGHFQKTQRISAIGTGRGGSEDGAGRPDCGDFIACRFSGPIAAEAGASEIFDE